LARFSAPQTFDGIKACILDQRNADRAAGEYPAGLDLDGLVGQVDQAHRHGVGAVARGIGLKDPELVLAEARQRVARAASLGEQPRHGRDEVIARLLAEAVIDLVEPVEIDAMNGKALLIGPDPAEGTVQAVYEQKTVGQAREGVVVGEVGYPCLAGHQSLRGQTTLALIPHGQDDERRQGNENKRHRKTKHLCAGLLGVPLNQRHCLARGVAQNECGMVWQARRRGCSKRSLAQEVAFGEDGQEILIDDFARNQHGGSGCLRQRQSEVGLNQCGGQGHGAEVGLRNGGRVDHFRRLAGQVPQMIRNRPAAALGLAHFLNHRGSGSECGTDPGQGVRVFLPFCVEGCVCPVENDRQVEVQHTGEVFADVRVRPFRIERDVEVPDGFVPERNGGRAPRVLVEQAVKAILEKGLFAFNGGFVGDVREGHQGDDDSDAQGGADQRHRPFLAPMPQPVCHGARTPNTETPGIRLTPA